MIRRTVAGLLLLALTRPGFAEPPSIQTPSTQPPPIQALPIQAPSSVPPPPIAKATGNADAVTAASQSATLCAAVDAASARHGLPAAFFARLIWQESRFDPLARSPAGAEGVAQFMPLTASGRGLLDPFAPAAALDESAAYLAELRAQFGNLGLAAAGYNAGPGRLARWLAGTATLPAETTAYVRAITGHEVEEWRSASPPSIDPDAGLSCGAVATAGRQPLAPPSKTAAVEARKPWAVILVGSFNKAAVLREWGIVRATFSRVLADQSPSVVRRRVAGEAVMKYVVQIEAENRASGDRLCKALERAGGNCVVLRNALR